MNLKTIITGILATGCAAGFAQSGDLNSRVIHNYSQAGIGYGFLQEIDGLGIDAQGVLAGASYEIDNFVIGVGGGYFMGDEEILQVSPDGLSFQKVDAEVWNVAGNAGYVFRAMGNHLNVIPNIGLSYTRAILDGGWGDDTPDTTTVLPGLNLSYALNNKLSIDGSYSYGFEIDGVETELHLLGLGATYAVTERIGVSAKGYFAEEQGFTGLTAGVAWHF